MDSSSSKRDAVVDLVNISDSDVENSDSSMSVSVSSPPIARGRKRRKPEDIENKLVSSILEINTNVAKMVHTQNEISKTLNRFVDKMDLFLTCFEDRIIDKSQRNGFNDSVDRDSTVGRKIPRKASNNVTTTSSTSEHRKSSENKEEEGKKVPGKQDKSQQKTVEKQSTKKSKPQPSQRITRTSVNTEKRTLGRRLNDKNK